MVLARTHLRALVVGTCLVAASMAMPVAAGAATTTVNVGARRYTPATVTVEVGDTVIWVWQVNGQSVTDDPVDGPRRFDSHHNCLLFLNCGTKGEQFSVTFDEPGTFEYFSRTDGSHRGQVVVTPPRQTEPPIPSPIPPEPSSSPSPSPQPSPSPSASPSTSASPAPSETSMPSPAETVASPSPSASSSEGPSTPAPSFEAFPAAPDPSASAVPGTVTDGPPSSGGGGGGTVWRLVGGAAVLGTLAIFGRRVLFAPPWPPA